MIVRASLLAVAMVLAACSSRPTEADARASYARHRAAIDRIDEQVRAAVGAIPSLSEPEPECAAVGGPAKLPVPGLDGLVAGLHCTEQKLRWYEAGDEALGRLRADVAPRWLDRPGVLGVAAETRRAGDTQWQTVVRIGLAPGGSREGRVAPAQGFALASRRVGWGEYQTAYQNGCGSFGDGDYHPGIEVAWETRAGAAAIRIETLVLTDHRTDRHWRSGLVCRATPPGGG